MLSKSSELIWTKVLGHHDCPAILTNQDVVFLIGHVLVQATCPVCVADNDPHCMDGLDLLRVHNPSLEDSEHANRFFRRHEGRDVAEGMEDFGGTQLKKIGFVWS